MTQVARHSGFAVVPRLVIRGDKFKDMPLIELGLYTGLKDICGDDGECFYALRNLANELHTSISTLSRYIPKLKERGLITADKKKKTNGHDVFHIRMVNIWQENDALYTIVSDRNNQSVPTQSTVSDRNRIVSDRNEKQSNQARDCFYLNANEEVINNTLNEEDRENRTNTLSEDAIASQTPSPSFSEMLAETDAHIEQEFEDWLRIMALSRQSSLSTDAPSLSSESSEQERVQSLIYVHNPGKPVTFDEIVAAQNKVHEEMAQENAHNPGGDTAPAPQASVRIADNTAPGQPTMQDEGKTIGQTPLITVLLSEPVMNDTWNADICVQYAEWKNKKCYDDLKRLKQLEAARTARRIDPTLTLARFQLAYDDWFVWWKDKKKGSFHVSDMNVKQENKFTRLENALNRIDDEAERYEKRKNFSVINGNKPNEPTRRSNVPTLQELQASKVGI